MPGTYFYKKLLRIPLSVSNIGVHLLLNRKVINISHKAEADLRALLYWYKVQGMEDTRLPKRCLQQQLKDAVKGNLCWATKIKMTLENLGLHEFWVKAPSNINIFRAICIEKLVQAERTRLEVLACQFSSLLHLRNVLTLAGRDAPLFAHEIMSHPEKRRWIAMVLLSCPGSLVIRQGNQSMCFLCGTPVNDIFSHLLAFCNRTQSIAWRRISMVNLISQLKANPGSAASIMIWGLFMSGDRSHIQREFVELFACLCSSVAGADL